MVVNSQFTLIKTSNAVTKSSELNHYYLSGTDLQRKGADGDVHSSQHRISIGVDDTFFFCYLSHIMSLHVLI